MLGLPGGLAVFAIRMMRGLSHTIHTIITSQGEILIAYSTICLESCFPQGDLKSSLNITDFTYNSIQIASFGLATLIPSCFPLVDV